MAKKRKIIGIDLGTTNSLVSYIKDGKPEIIPNERGNRKTPSAVLFKENGEIIVGELAKNQAVLNSENTVLNTKLEMGAQKVYQINDKEYTPINISALILKRLKGYAERYLETQINEAVITVPAYFDDNQREATLKAAEEANLKVLKLLNEPTAAALTYGFSQKKEGRFLVIDMGGGTLDITLMEFKNKIFHVRGVGGDTSIGGINFDQAIIKYILEKFEKTYSIKLENDPIAYQQISIHAEQVKIDLSSVEETKIIIPYITVTPKGPVHLNLGLRRIEFENLVSDTIQKIKKHILNTFEETGLKPNWIDSVILVGGSTRVPALEKLISEILITNLNLEKNQTAQVNLFMNEKLKREINPDEAVGAGAGILAGMLEGSIKNIEFHDITSHNLGIEDDNGNFITIIPKGKAYPVSQSHLFTTVRDNQEEVCIKILQDTGLKDQKQYIPLGMFHFPVNAEQKKGVPDIDVTFKINENGVLKVSAIDIETTEIKEITITNNKLT